MSAINVNSITGRTGTHGPVLTGVTTATNGLNITGGSVGIGTDNPTSELHVSALGATDEPTIKITGENSSIFLRTAGSSGSFPTGGVGNDGELIYLGGDFRFGVGTANKNLIFFNGSGYTERLRITSGGELQIANGNLKFSTSGTGIDFSSNDNTAGMTSEVLDDYEEGTWTPTYFGATTAGSYSLTSTQAKYTKIGNTVHLYVDIKNIIQSSAGSGLLRIGGLPFIPSNGNEAGSVILENFSFPSSVEYAVLRTSSTDFLYLVGIRNSGVDVQFNVTDRDSNTSDIFGQITYMTSA